MWSQTTMTMLSHPLSSSLRRLLFVLSYCGMMSAVAEKDVMKEYCEDETFSPTCGPNQVIVMEVARYGRMKMGNCLTTTYGSVGCSRDILPQVDVLCSGQRSCRLNVRDLLTHNPCAKDLRGYLEAQYTCLTVLSPDVERCRQRSAIRVTELAPRDPSGAPPSGYLSNYVTELTGCGNIDSPWRIVAEPGQRINLTLIDFGVALSGSAKSPSGGDGSAVCQVLAVIRDRESTSTTMSETICGNQYRRRNIMTSSSHDVEVRMVFKSKREDQGRYILIRYQVIGCPDVAVTSDTSFKRTVSGAVIGCVRGGDIWQLTCENGRWRGEHGNCSDATLAMSGAVSRGLLQLPFGVNMTIMAAVAILIGLAVLVGGLILVRRRLMIKNTPPPPTPSDVYFQQKTQLYADFRSGGPTTAGAQQRLVSRKGMLHPGAVSIGYAGGGVIGRVGTSQQLQTAGIFGGYRGGCGGGNGRSPSSPGGSLLYHGSVDYGAPEARYVEHIYESPTCARKDLVDVGPADRGSRTVEQPADGEASAAGSLQYYEIDAGRRPPDVMRIQQQQQAGSL